METFFELLELNKDNRRGYTVILALGVIFNALILLM